MVSVRRTFACASAWGVFACAAALAASLAFASSAAAECPNEALRRESNTNPTTGQPYSEALPDCRAYEMVSPVYKQEREAVGLPSGSSGFPVAPGGETAAWGSIGAFSNPENFNLFHNPYLSQRVGSSWSTSSAFAPRTLVDGPGESGIESDSSPDLRSAQVTCGTSPLEQGQRGTGAAFTVKCARREGGGSWSSTPAYGYLDSGAHVSYYVGGSSSDLSRVFIHATGKLLPKDTVSEPNQAGIYEIAGCCTPSSKLRLVNVANNGEDLVVLHTEGLPPSSVFEEPFLGDWRQAGAFAGSVYHAISESGGTVFLTATPNKAEEENSQILTVYARINCGTTAKHSPAPCTEDKEGREGEWFETVPVSNPSEKECKECIPGATHHEATFQAASADGKKVFFTTEQKLLDEDNTYNLYEYDFNKPEGEKLVLLSKDAAGANVTGVLRVSPDGSHVYFVASGVLENANCTNCKEAQVNMSNLYGYDTVTGETKFVAEISGELVNRIGRQVSQDYERHAQTTPDGRFLVFSTSGSLAGDVNNSAAQAVYRYDFQTGELTWVSHGAPGFKVENEGEGKYKGESKDALVAPLPGTLPNGGTVPIGADANIDDWNRAISENGEYIIFASEEKLQANDLNHAPGLFEWHNGIVSMISDGRDPRGVSANTFAMSASGADIFFTTGTALVGQDTDVLGDLYDARVGGGFPAPPAEPSCSADTCQGPPSGVPSFPSATSSLFTGGQNLSPPLISVATSMNTKPRPLTRAQLLAKALKACKGKPKRKRALCQSQARKKYASKAKAKAKAKSRRRGT
jgi:hypothetical protein